MTPKAAPPERVGSPIADPMGLIGQTLDGQFRVDVVIGEGGFSVVYKGFHLGLGEAIAIKCLKLESTLGSAMVESFVRRFRDEGRILYRLSQGNLHIVRSIASGTTIAPATSSLIPYTVLEWLEGRSLAQELELRRRVGMRGRTLDEVMLLLDSAAIAVAYAHEAGVVHRDLNPGNIFLAQTREGVKAKVLDFGLAKVVSDHYLELGPRVATFGRIRIFSPAYAAPEQLDDRLGKIAPWTDVYTFAVVFLETLCDAPVVDGEDLETLVTKTLDAEHRPTPRALGLGPDRISNAVEAVFARALSLEPRARFRDLGEMWGTLKAAMQKPNARSPSALPRQGSSPAFATTPRRRDTPTELVHRPATNSADAAPNTQRMAPPPNRTPTTPTRPPESAPSRASARSFPKLDHTLRMDDPSLQSIAHSIEEHRASDSALAAQRRALGVDAGTRSVVVPPRRGMWLLAIAMLLGAFVALGGLFLLARALHVALPMPKRFR